MWMSPIPPLCLKCLLLSFFGLKLGRCICHVHTLYWCVFPALLLLFEWMTNPFVSIQVLVPHRYLSFHFKVLPLYSISVSRPNLFHFPLIKIVTKTLSNSLCSICVLCGKFGAVCASVHVTPELCACHKCVWPPTSPAPWEVCLMRIYELISIAEFFPGKNEA